MGALVYAALFDIYGLTQDERYLKTAQRFEHRAILDPLLAGRDELPGKHANTQIPKVIGAVRGYEVANQSEGRPIAENFWKEPKQGMFTYFMSLEPGHYKTYSTPHDSFWCCVGSGMENHSKYGAAIYFHTSDSLFVNLFIPSVLRWQERGLELQQTTSYPNENRTSLTVAKAPAKSLSLRVRVPAWASGNAALTLNGKPVEVDAKPGSYATGRTISSRLFMDRSCSPEIRRS